MSKFSHCISDNFASFKKLLDLFVKINLSCLDGLTSALQASKIHALQRIMYFKSVHEFLIGAKGRLSTTYPGGVVKKRLQVQGWVVV